MTEQNARAVLERFYRRVVPDGVSLLTVTNGMSNASIWQVARGADARCALRCWGAPGPRIAAVSRISRVLQYAEQNGVDFVPTPLPADNGHRACEWQGKLWELAPWMPGRACTEDDSLEKLLLATGALTRFHAATAHFPLPGEETATRPSPAIVDRVRKLAAAATVDWPAVALRFPKTLCDHEVAGVLCEIAGLLGRAIPVALSAVSEVEVRSQRLQVIIRDPRREHFLFSSDHVGGANRVTGLVDFGAMTVDSPAVDFARLWGEWAGDNLPVWQAAVEQCPLPATARRLLGPLDASGVVLSCCNWLRWIAEGRPAPGERLQRLHARLECLVAGESPYFGVHWE